MLRTAFAVVALAGVAGPALPAAAKHAPPAPSCRSRDGVLAALKGIAAEVDGSLLDVDAAGTALMLPVWNAVPPATRTAAEETLIVLAPRMPNVLIVFLHNGRACASPGLASRETLMKMVGALPDRPEAQQAKPPSPEYEPDLKL